MTDLTNPLPDTFKLWGGREINNLVEDNLNQSVGPTGPSAGTGPTGPAGAAGATGASGPTGSQPLTALSGLIGGTALNAWTTTGGNVTVTGVNTSMAAIASPTNSPGNSFVWGAQAIATNLIKVTVTNVTNVTATPTATTFQVRALA